MNNGCSPGAQDIGQHVLDILCAVQAPPQAAGVEPSNLCEDVVTCAPGCTACLSVWVHGVLATQVACRRCTGLLTTVLVGHRYGCKVSNKGCHNSVRLLTAHVKHAAHCTWHANAHNLGVVGAPRKLPAAANRACAPVAAPTQHSRCPTDKFGWTQSDNLMI